MGQKYSHDALVPWLLRSRWITYCLLWKAPATSELLHHIWGFLRKPTKLVWSLTSVSPRTKTDPPFHAVFNTEDRLAHLVHNHGRWGRWEFGSPKWHSSLGPYRLVATSLPWFFGCKKAPKKHPQVVNGQNEQCSKPTSDIPVWLVHRDAYNGK